MNRRENRPHPEDAFLQLQEAETLIWDLLDERLDDEALGRLTHLLESNASIRAHYIDCVQLHVDLQEHFGRKSLEESPGSRDAVVLQHLLPGLAGMPGFPQAVD